MSTGQRIAGTDKGDAGLLALQVIMLERGLKARDIAARCGLNVRTVQNVISGSNVNITSRRRVEDAVGCPIWSGLEEFKARQGKSQMKEMK